MKIRSRFFAIASATLGAAMLLPAVANAVTCPADVECNGNTYTASTVNMGGSVWQTTVTVNVLAGYTGTLGSDKLSALAIKNMASAPLTSASLISYPGGGDAFNFYTGELNNGGAVCADDNKPGTKLCAWAGDKKGVVVDAGDVLMFVFQYTAATVYDTLHIKYQYIDSKGKKVGSLGSFEIPNEGCVDCEQQAPEPGSLALLGLGMLGLGLSRRRRA